MDCISDRGDVSQYMPKLVRHDDAVYVNESSYWFKGWNESGSLLFILVISFHVLLCG